MAFGCAEKVESVARGESYSKSAGFSETNVFAGHAHEAAREVERIFAGFQHAGEPIESGVGIGVADGFVKRGDEIVVLIAGFVVAEQFALQNVGEKFFIEMAISRGVWNCGT